MAKTKISEFSATPANNTDIDSINIAEGCAPSGINDAIRELMAQLKDFQTGAVGDSFNGPVGTSTAAAGAFTNLSASSTLGVTGVSTLTGGAVVQGLTVGRGAGAVSTNTAVGASALGSNTTGANNTAVGYEAADIVTTGTQNVAMGRGSLGSMVSGSDNTGVGFGALNQSTGSSNTAVGSGSLQVATSASNNVAIGYQASYSSTTADENVAIGSEAMASTTTGNAQVAVGKNALRNNTTGAENTAVGRTALQGTTTGTLNAGLGRGVLQTNSTGSYNTASGAFALFSNTTANDNTAVGFQAGYSNTTAAGTTAIGNRAGFSTTTGNYNTSVGDYAGYSNTTGVWNTFIGKNSGYNITTGSKNTILGGYNGNQGSLDIRTTSNNIVLSDGDGNPYGQCNASFWKFGIGGTGAAYGGGSVSLNGSTANGYQPTIGGYGNGSAYWTVGTKGAIDGSSSAFLQCQNTGGGVFLNGASATAWTAVSDERVKENLVEITNAATKVASLRAVIGNYTWDTEKVRRPFLIAQDVQAVLPEAVTSTPHKDLGQELGVAYTEVIPLLVAAIKELKAEFDAYKLTHP